MKAEGFPASADNALTEGTKEPPTKPFRAYLKRHSLPVGIILMFLLTWPIMLAGSGFLPFKVPFIVGLVAGWGVSIAALIMTGLTLGRQGVVALLKRFLIWRVSWRWYLVALLFFPLTQAISVWANSMLTGTPVDFSTVVAHSIFGAGAFLPVFILPFFVTDMLANGEELGWRGYVLPRLQARYSALVASLILGVIWAIWHLPILVTPGNNSSLALWMVKIIVESVLYTWLYNNTRGSLLLVTLLHAASNTGSAFLPAANRIAGATGNAMTIQVALEILVAIAVVATQGSADLSRTEHRQMQS